MFVDDICTGFEFVLMKLQMCRSEDMQETNIIRGEYLLTMAALVVSFRNLNCFSLAIRLSSTSHTTRELDCKMAFTNKQTNKQKHLNCVNQEIVKSLLVILCF